MSESIFGIIKVRVVGVLDHIPGSVILVLVVDGVDKLVLRVDCGMERVARAAVDSLVPAVAPGVVGPGKIERGTATSSTAAGLIQS